ncbi:MAG: hypothetical protein JXC36_02775 [Candidatus Atribacteria bacterium]|nr:hypothetical protein [Candidatus Atribacteria bacterium]
MHSDIIVENSCETTKYKELIGIALETITDMVAEFGLKREYSFAEKRLTYKYLQVFLDADDMIKLDLIINDYQTILSIVTNIKEPSKDSINRDRWNQWNSNFDKAFRFIISSIFLNLRKIDKTLTSFDSALKNKLLEDTKKQSFINSLPASENSILGFIKSELENLSIEDNGQNAAISKGVQVLNSLLEDNHIDEGFYNGLKNYLLHGNTGKYDKNTAHYKTFIICEVFKSKGILQIDDTYRFLIENFTHKGKEIFSKKISDNISNEKIRYNDAKGQVLKYDYFYKLVDRLFYQLPS